MRRWISAARTCGDETKPVKAHRQRVLLGYVNPNNQSALYKHISEPSVGTRQLRFGVLLLPSVSLDLIKHRLNALPFSDRVRDESEKRLYNAD